MIICGCCQSGDSAKKKTKKLHEKKSFFLKLFGIVYVTCWNCADCLQKFTCLPCRLLIFSCATCGDGAWSTPIHSLERSAFVNFLFADTYEISLKAWFTFINAGCAMSILNGIQSAHGDAKNYEWAASHMLSNIHSVTEKLSLLQKL